MANPRVAAALSGGHVAEPLTDGLTDRPTDSAMTDGGGGGGSGAGQLGTGACGGAICDEPRARSWAAPSLAVGVGSGSGEVAAHGGGEACGGIGGSGGSARARVRWVDGDVTYDERLDNGDRRPSGLTEAGGSDERHRCSQRAMTAQVTASSPRGAISSRPRMVPPT